MKRPPAERGQRGLRAAASGVVVGGHTVNERP